MPPAMTISEQECLRIAKYLDPLSLPDSCREFLVKNQKAKDAWAGASHKDRMNANHAQIQRRLTSSRSMQRQPTKTVHSLKA
mmetsp:Transcript_19468/g.57908  ORF Transcript_19468/g.57908 Transcript_19468/m.57908 type:complete len:82 (+) Transcript_19468:68-313(+)